MKNLGSNIPKEDIEMIVKILERYEKRVKDYTRTENLLDLMNCQKGSCQLDLHKLLNADDADFFHDLNGIKAHMDRRSGTIKNGFLPRMILEVEEERENLKYQELDGFNLALDQVRKGDNVSYEVVEEYEDGTYIPRSFNIYTNAMNYFNNFVDMTI